MTEKQSEGEKGNPTSQQSDTQCSTATALVVPSQDGARGFGQANVEQSNPDDAGSAMQEPHWLQKFNFVGEIGLVIVGIVAASIYGCQLRTMNRTYMEIRTQTKVAQRAVAAALAANSDARNRFRQDERPYVGQTSRTTEEPQWYPFPTDTSRGQILWNWHMTNYGKSPANNVLFTQEIKVAGHPFVPSYGEKGPSIGRPQLPGGDTFATVVSAPMKIEDFDKLLKISGGISIRIRISYTGLDGSKYQSGLCMSRTNAGSITYCKHDNYIK